MKKTIFIVVAFIGMTIALPAAAQTSVTASQERLIALLTQQLALLQAQLKELEQSAQVGDTLSVKYTGKFANGKIFDATSQHGDKPIIFTLGIGQVIKGWDQGLIGMKVGEKRSLIIPPELGYGPNDYGPIPGNSTLYFDVELIGRTPAVQTR